MYQEVNQLLKKCYNEQTTLRLNDFLNILYDSKNFYLLNTNKKLTFIDVDDFDNYYPKHGILSMEINNIIDFLNSEEYQQKENLSFRELYDEVGKNTELLASIHKLIFAVIHYIDLYNFHYFEEDIDEVINFILLFNRFHEIIEIDDVLMIYVFQERFEQLDKNVIFSLLLERIGFNEKQSINLKARKNQEYAKTIEILKEEDKDCKKNGDLFSKMILQLTNSKIKIPYYTE